MTLNQALMALTLSLAAGGAMAAGTTVDFSNGNEGWYGMQPADGNGGSGIDTSLGNNAPALRTEIVNYGLTFATSTNAAFLGDYTAKGAVTLGLDIKASDVSYYGTPVSRDIVVELRDYGNTPEGMPYTSVWFKLGSIDGTKDWQHLSVTIADPSSTVLPAGWGGYGAAGGGPLLPAGRSFADVLASVDEVAFTTYVPGFSYGFTKFDVAVDNISISPVPEPSTYAMLVGGLGLIGWMRRRQGRQQAGAAAAA